MSEKRQARSGEEWIIGRFFRPIARSAGALGLADDAALLSPPPGHDLVLTVRVFGSTAPEVAVPSSPRLQRRLHNRGPPLA